MSTLRKVQKVSPEAYFAYEDTIEGRAEYYDGVIVDMAGSSPDHSKITANVITELSIAMRGSGCSVYSPDIRIAVGAANSYLHPDVAVICGELEVSDLRKDSVRNPRLVVEVLSSSTATRDRGEKFELYKALDSLQEYVLVEQDVPQVYVYSRSATGEWVYHVYYGLETQVKLSCLGISVPMASIYYDVVFPATPLEEENQ